MAQGTITIKGISIILKHSPLCFWCNKSYDNNYHIDYFYPISLGGTNSIDNIVVSCPRCNLTKSNKDPKIFARQIGRNTAILYEEDYHEW